MVELDQFQSILASYTEPLVGKGIPLTWLTKKSGLKN